MNQVDVRHLIEKEIIIKVSKWRQLSTYDTCTHDNQSFEPESMVLVSLLREGFALIDIWLENLERTRLILCTAS